MKPAVGQQIRWMVGANLREAVRRKDVYVLLIIMSLFLGFCLIQRVIGIENPATGTFLLNLALSLAAVCAHLIAVVFGCRQLSAEYENRTLWTLLARPITAARLVVAKWLAATAAGCVMGGLLMAGAFATVPMLEPCQPAAGLQMLALAAASVGLFAAMSLPVSLLMPRVAAVPAVFGWFLVSGFVTGRMQQAGPLAQWISRMLPDAARYNLVTRFTDGLNGAPTGVLAGLLGLAGLHIILLLAWAVRRVENRHG